MKMEDTAFKIILWNNYNFYIQREKYKTWNFYRVEFWKIDIAE